MMKCFAAAAVAGLIASSSAGVNSYTFDAADGLPDSEQWGLITESGPSAPTLQGDAILFDTRPFSRFAYQSYTANLPDEGSLLEGVWSFEVEAQIIESPQGNGFGFWRSGFSFGISDEASRFISFEIGSDSIALRTQNTAGEQVAGLDLTSGFNTFRMDIVDGFARAYINDELVASLAVAFNADASRLRAAFGDRTNIFNGAALVRSASLQIPAPAGLAAFGICGLAARRRR